jgi:hypothetical protein
MTEHVAKARVTGGRVEGGTTDGPESVNWQLKDLHIGRWECSCGEEFENERQAAQHLRSVNTGMDQEGVE